MRSSIFLYTNLDILTSAVEGIKDDKEPDLTEQINNIKSFRDSQAGEAGTIDLKGVIDNSIASVLSEYEEHRLKTNIKDGNGVYLLKTVLDLSSFDTALEELTKNIKSLGELISTLPISADVPDGSIGFNLLFGSNRLQSDITQAFGKDLEMLLSRGSRQSHHRKKKKLY